VTERSRRLAAPLVALTACVLLGASMPAGVSRPTTITTQKLYMSGMAMDPKTITTSKLFMAGLAMDPKTINTAKLYMSGLAPH